MHSQQSVNTKLHGGQINAAAVPRQVGKKKKNKPLVWDGLAGRFWKLQPPDKLQINEKTKRKPFSPSPLRFPPLCCSASQPPGTPQDLPSCCCRLSAGRAVLAGSGARGSLLHGLGTGSVGTSSEGPVAAPVQEGPFLGLTALGASPGPAPSPAALRALLAAPRGGGTAAHGGGRGGCSRPEARFSPLPTPSHPFSPLLSRVGLVGAAASPRAASRPPGAGRGGRGAGPGP